MPSFWNTRVLYGPVPALLWPIDLALSIACLNPSAVEMSGLGAPAFTATPLPARANSATVPATTLLFLASSSKVGRKFTTRSPGASLLIFSACCGMPTKSTTTLCPLAFSKAAARSRTPDTAPWLTRMVTSAACAGALLQRRSAPSRASVRTLVDFMTSSPMVFALPTKSCGVVPAQAGTHTHRGFGLTSAVPIARHDVWVPAFAGTTQGDLSWLRPTATIAAAAARPGPDR